MKDLDTLISEFAPIDLSEMDAVQLMKRTDTKYVFGAEELIPLLEGVKNDYKVLSVGNVRSNRYKTLYYDTEASDFYLQHQNGKLNRNKVRFRKYLDSDLCFLEIKFKNNKGQTIKKRIKVDDFRDQLTEKQAGYVTGITHVQSELVPKIWNSFHRITLVNQELKERLTIDYNLKFELGDQQLELPNVIIAELKQERINRNSPFAEMAKKLSIRDTRISKYCIGSALLNKNLKSNRFKTKILTLKKITNGLVA